jgi:hypothetical protein
MIAMDEINARGLFYSSASKRNPAPINGAGLTVINVG